MRLLRRVAVFALVGVVPAAGNSQQGTLVPPSLVLDGVTVVDVEQGNLVPAQRVVITGNRIEAIGRPETVKLPKGAQVVDARGKYLIPGLWDMHFHSYGYPPGPIYSLLVANGVTGIRDPAQFVPLDTLLQWRAEIARGERVGPRQVVTGSMLDDANLYNGLDKGTGRSTNQLEKFEGARRIAIRTETPEEARHAVDSLHRAGAEFIKTHSNGVSRETFLAMAAEAKRLGIRLEGHLPGLVSIEEASDSGMRILDHLAQLMGVFGPNKLDGICSGDAATVETCTTLARRLRRNGTWIVIGPTDQRGIAVRSNLPHLPDSLRRTSAQPDTNTPSSPCVTLGLMARSGMPLLSGTDVSVGDAWLPSSLIHEELAFAVRCGMTSLQALQTVTLNPARYLRGTDSLGTVKPRKVADLVLLDADPLADITNTTAIRAVVANGRFFDRAALDALLQQAMQAEGKPAREP